MNAMYRSLGISKQAVHQKLERRIRMKREQHNILHLVYEIRSNHPTMGLRDMYYKLDVDTMGRDAFEVMCKQHGLQSRKARNYRRTTDSRGVTRFANLLKEGKNVANAVNKVWVSDITYIGIKDRYYYLTFITDAYSRRILGYQASARLTTESTTLPALKMALRTRRKSQLENLILHSDGGGQYYDKDFLKLTQKYKIRNSMCEYAWENGKAERLNGVIKNNYLEHKSISSFEQLQRELVKIVQLYNIDKPHCKLGRMSPINFENSYLCHGQKIEGVRPATECITAQRAINSPAGCGQKISGSETTLECLENRKKTVNVI
jgi:putative transposase